MKVLAIVQCINPDDANTSFIVGWLKRLAREVDELHVLSLEAHPISKPDNMFVYSLGKENGRPWLGKTMYSLRWLKQMTKILRSAKPDIVFTHMTPTYSALAWPFAKAAGIPIVTWFSYPGMKSNLFLRLGHAASDRIVSISEETYPLTQEKTVALGHSIDMNVFRPPVDETRTGGLLCVGRIYPPKNHWVMIDALSQLKRKGIPLKCHIVGGMAQKGGYREKLIGWIRKFDVVEEITFGIAISNENLPATYGNHRIHVNCRHVLDKTGLEAMACGTLAVAPRDKFSEDFYGPLTDLFTFERDSPESLAATLERLLALPPTEAKRLGLELRQIVEDRFSLDRLMKKLIAVFKDAITRQPLNAQPVVA